MNEREVSRNDFIKKVNLSNCAIVPSPGDLSSRKYFRITKNDNQTLILMDSPAEEKTKEFYLMTEYLLKNGFSVPKIYEHDLDNGFLIIEDFNDTKVNDLLSGKISCEDVYEERIYKRTIDILMHLHQCELPSFLNEQKDEDLVKEAERIIQWYIEPLNGTPLSEEMKQQFHDLLLSSLNQAKLFKPVVTLRDYHVDNMFWLNDRLGIERLGLIDYQDAELGSPAYDIVSVLEDARRDVSPDLAHKMLAYYLQEMSSFDRKDMLSAYHIYGAQRNIKIIGIFAMRAATQNKSYLLTLLPRVLGYLYQDLSHPLLNELKQWFDEAIPRQHVISSMTYGGGMTKIWSEI